MAKKRALWSPTIFGSYLAELRACAASCVIQNPNSWERSSCLQQPEGAIVPYDPYVPIHNHPCWPRGFVIHILPPKHSPSQADEESPASTEIEPEPSASSSCSSQCVLDMMVESSRYLLQMSRLQAFSIPSILLTAPHESLGIRAPWVLLPLLKVPAKQPSFELWRGSSLRPGDFNRTAQSSFVITP